MGFWDWVTGKEEPPHVPEVIIPAAPTADDIRQSLDAIEADVMAQGLSGPIAFRVGRVCNLVRGVLPRVDSLGWGSLDAFSVMSTATDYLPEAIRGYVRLPRDWADSRPVDGGKTSLMLLIDQLDLLAATVSKISDAINHADAAELITHGRFLQEKFGKSDAPTITLDGTTDE